jgi:UDP-N-acetylglucosamine:LPS N-acetylglucosamine transferase
MTELAALLEHQSLWPESPAMLVSSLALGGTTILPDVSGHVIGECDRNQPGKAFATLVRSVALAWRERPDVVITTGSLPLAIFSLACRLFGARIVWIDSISQIEGISLSGKLVRPFADRFFVQWPELASKYAGTVYAGELV